MTAMLKRAVVAKEHLPKGQVYVPGIMGGLGPVAGCDFVGLLIKRNYERLRQKSSVPARDQQYFVWNYINASTVPDRTEFLEWQRQQIQDGNIKKEDPVPYMVDYARALQAAGSDFIVVICNTSHAFHEAVQRQIEIPWIHMIKVTAQWIKENMPEVKRVGTIGTTGTNRHKLYIDILTECGLIPIAPDPDSTLQTSIHGAIYNPEYGIKYTGTQVSERSRSDLMKAERSMVNQGAQINIAACTEVPIGLEQGLCSVPLINPSLILADTVLDIAAGRKKPFDYLIRY